VHVDSESSETIISGMGELHLEIYIERIRREYDCEVITDKPKVAFRETISTPAQFDYLHRKQTGGSGQYGRVMGDYLPIDWSLPNQFTNATVGMNIGPDFIPAIEKGFYEACEKGALTGHPIIGTHFILRDGATHVVDSNELAFRLATKGAVRQGLFLDHSGGTAY
jgi:elongation factor G